jgi:molecular chaperone DnaK (HSP70)
VRDAEMFASKDKERKELIEAKNSADNLAYSSEKSLDEHKEKLPQPIVDEISTAISDLRAAAQTENVEDINSKIDAMQKSVMKIGEELQRQSGGGGSDANTDGGNADGGAQDAEYTKADEDKEKKE